MLDFGEIAQGLIEWYTCFTVPETPKLEDLQRRIFQELEESYWAGHSDGYEEGVNMGYSEGWDAGHVYED